MQSRARGKWLWTVLTVGHEMSLVYSAHLFAVPPTLQCSPLCCPPTPKYQLAKIKGGREWGSHPQL